MIIYKIFRKHGHVGVQEIGFFSYLLGFVGHFVRAKELGHIPQVDMTNQDIFYLQPDKQINGANNVWEYFFKQPSENIITDENILSCDGLYNGPLVYSDIPKKIVVDNVLLEEYAWVLPPIREFFVFRDEIANELNKKLSELIINKKILGVHVRYNRDLSVTHKINIPKISEYIEKSKALCKQYNLDNVFVMSDATEVISEFQREFGNQAVFTSAYRRDANGNIYEYNNSRTMHRYLSGLEIITDTFLLAHCMGLLGLCSNVYDMGIYWSEVYNKQNRLFVEYMF